MWYASPAIRLAIVSMERASSDLAHGGAWWTVRCGGRGDVCTGGVYRDEAEMYAPDGGHAVSGRTYAR